LARDAIDDLLAKLEARPSDAPVLLSRALAGESRKAVQAALGQDARFAPVLTRVAESPGGLDEAKWVVQYLGRQHYAPAVPALLAAWRRHVGGLSYQAGRALVEIGERESLEAMVRDLESLSDPLELTAAIEAAVALGGPYERLASALASDRVAVSVLAFLSKEAGTFDRDARWESFAIDCLEKRPASVAATARSLLVAKRGKRVVQQLEKARGTATGAPQAKVPTKGTLDAADARIRDILDSLDRSSWTKPPKTQTDRIAKIEAIVGPLPAMAHALYRAADGIHVKAVKPKDSFVVSPLASAVDAARAFSRKHAPKSTPRDLIPPFLFPVAPDGYEKAGLSGGPPIGFELPCADDDPELVNLRGRPKLSVFLRRAKRVDDRERSKRRGGG
jgi:hypothetical protein